MRHWVMDGLYINEFSFVQLILLCIEHTPITPGEQGEHYEKCFFMIDGLQTKISALNLHNAK